MPLWLSGPGTDASTELTDSHPDRHLEPGHSQHPEPHQQPGPDHRIGLTEPDLR